MNTEKLSYRHKFILEMLCKADNKTEKEIIEKSLELLNAVSIPGEPLLFMHDCPEVDYVIFLLRGNSCPKCGEVAG